MCFCPKLLENEAVSAQITCNTILLYTDISYLHIIKPRMLYKRIFLLSEWFLNFFRAEVLNIGL